MLKQWCIITVTIFVLLPLALKADGSIAGLLDTIEMSSDLSQKTKLENSGFSTIYTRTDLDMMQVKSLRDILKYSIDGYSESRYGLPDPLTNGVLPFSSSSIRVFIDDHEITTSMYGSGLIVIGDLDLGFVDHIAVYSLSTSFVYSTEPVLTLVRIFSKKMGRDEGGSIQSEVTSRRGSTQNIQYIGHEKGIEYLARFSATNDERKTYATTQDDLNRDVRRYNILTTLKDETQSVLINASKSDKGGWLGASLDGSLDTSKISFKDAHISYAKQMDDLKFSLAYDTLKDHVLYEDSPLMYYKSNPIYRFESISNSSVITSEFKYTTQMEDHHLVAGIRYRYKLFDFDLIQMNEIDMPRSGHTKQGVGSTFVEDSYAIHDNLIATIGLQASQVTNNGGVKDETLFMARSGITYTTDAWTSKSFFFHTENYVDPYLINSFYVASPYPKNQIMNTLAQEFKYENGNSDYEFLTSYSFIDNMYFINQSSLVDTAEKTSTYLTTSLRYSYHYGSVDTVSLAYIYKDIDNKGYDQESKNHRVTFRNQHRYEKFDFFEELFVGHNEQMHETGYDLTLGIRYHANEDLSFTLKGQNLLNKAEKEYFTRFDPTSMTSMDALGVPVQDRVVMIGFEWLF